MMIKKFMSGVLVASLLVLAACAGQKGPATTAMAAAESTLASIKDDAAKYLPEELKGAEGTLASLKNSLEKGDYKAVMAGAPALMSSLDSLKTQVGAKLEEAKVATAEWAGYATDLPKMVEAIQSRVTTLSSAKKLPSGLNAAALDTAKNDLASMQSTWADAAAAFTGGNAIDAVAKAKAVKAKGEEVLKLLGMSAG
jgi:predicted small lipoprotein YifL